MSERKIDFLIITPLEEERDALLRQLPDVKKLAPESGDIRCYYSSNLPITFADNTTGIYSIVVTLLLGMGRVQAANATTDGISRFQPDYVLLVGIAGGFAKAGVKLGDILVSDQIVDYESQKLTSNGHKVHYKVYPTDARLLVASKNLRSNEWQQKITTSRTENGVPVRHIGPTLSGDKSVALGEFLALYAEDWPKLKGVEMEAGGVASASFQAAQKPGFFMIRGVSDLANEDEQTHTVQQWRSYACHVAASYTVALLESEPVPLRKKNPPIEPPGEKKPVQPTKPSLQQLHRDELLEKVEYEITQRLRNILSNKIFHPPKVLDRSYVESRPYTYKELQLPQKEELPNYTSLLDVFNRPSINGRLLILGKPGSGKTPLQLELAKSLIQNARKNPASPIPVLLELSYWQSRNSDFKKWIITQIVNKYYKYYNFSKLSHTKNWLENENFILLLDDLNEVEYNLYKNCLDCLKNYLEKNHNQKLVVCSRLEEYESRLNQQKGKIFLNEAIILKDLEEKQIQDYFQQNKLNDLWSKIQSNADLINLAKTPFSLSMIISILKYNDQWPNLVSSPIEIQSLLEVYVKTILEQGRFKSKQAKLWLAWLSDHLEQKYKEQKHKKYNKKEFLIEELQPNSLDLKVKNNYILGNMFIYALFGWLLVCSLKFVFQEGQSFQYNQYKWLFIDISVTLSLGLLGGLFLPKEITLNETIKINRINHKFLMILLGYSLLGGIIGFFIVLISSKDPIFLIIGIVTGFLFGMLQVCFSVETSNREDHRKMSNQGIKTTAINAIIVFVIVEGIIFVFFGQNLWHNKGPKGIIAALIPGFGLGITYGGSACIQHFCLRLILYIQGYIPWNYARFLDYYTERKLLQRVGGRYRFINKMLQEYFQEYFKKHLL